MIYVKTQSGQEAFKDRRGVLTPRQRSAFLLFDGRRSLDQVLAATAAMGITQIDVQSMISHGLLEPLIARTAGSAPASALSAAHSTFATSALPDAIESISKLPYADAAEAAIPSEASQRSTSERYQSAYRIATELTATLGLRGLPLTLAVEAAGGYKELLALAPKIKAAVGESKFARLEQALLG